MSMGNQELKDRVDRHGKWLRNETGGARFTAKEFRENFSCANLSGANLRSADLSGADLSGADLSGADLRSANLSGADLSGANLRSANLSGANLSGADLSGANLRSANLSGANLSGADLSGADLSGADLSGANLRSADLSGADLRSANLRSANLRSANLRSANLRSANLSGANLSGADLSGADLRSANLSGANLSEIKADFLTRLALAKNEVRGLYDYLQKGKVDGSSYSGECACFVGTIANIRKENYDALTCDLRPAASSPTERLFLGILKGDTPQSNQISKVVCEWIEEYAKENSISLPKYKIVSSDECPAAFAELPPITDLAAAPKALDPAKAKERRQFVKAAMVGLIPVLQDDKKDIGKIAVQVADAVLKELE